jgi:hypothetical protein
VSIPLFLLLLLGARAETILRKMRAWMNTNSWVVSLIRSRRNLLDLPGASPFVEPARSPGSELPAGDGRSLVGRMVGRPDGEDLPWPPTVAWGLTMNGMEAGFPCLPRSGQGAPGRCPLSGRGVRRD